MIYILVVIAIQFALATETVREVFTPIDRMEGISTAAIIDNIGSVEVELSAERLESFENPLNSWNGENLRILVNGQIAGYFNEAQITLSVRNNSLIEIDARNETIPFRVRVTEISDNAADVSRSLSVVTNQNIAILGKIHINDEFQLLPWGML